MFHEEPALYRRFLEIASEWETVVARALAAERGIDPAADMYSQMLATSLVGACRAAFRVWLAAPELPLAQRMEDALELIESGFGLASERG
jgi:hypothetical protein